MPDENADLGDADSGAEAGAGRACLEKIGSIVHGALMHQGLELGRKLGLLDALCAHMEPRSSGEIAATCRLKERYVREWLGAMTAAGIVSIAGPGEVDDERYYVSGAMAGVLQSPALQLGQAVTELSVHDDLVECFRADGPTGIPYSKYTRFHAWMATMRDNSFRQHVTTGFVDSVPGLKEMLERGVTLCDVGCGSGVPSILLAQAFPNSTFYGFDLCADAIERAQAGAEEAGVADHCHFFAYDAQSLPESWSGKFDVVTAWDAIHDQARPDLGLAACWRMTRPRGGMFLMHEPKALSAHRDNALGRYLREFSVHVPGYQPANLYMCSLMHCLPVSLYFPGGMGLGAAWGRERALAMLAQAGFPKGGVRVSEISYDPFNLLYIASRNE